MSKHLYGNDVTRQLATALKRSDLPDDARKAIETAVTFLRTRLTDAAKSGCHHCGEGDRGTPCWRCGLKN